MLKLKERSKRVSSSDNHPLFPIHLFPFARKLRGTTQAGTAFFATDCFFALTYLLSWPSLLNPWLRRYIETQSNRADIDAA
jgi:hypothetical protein